MSKRGFEQQPSHGGGGDYKRVKDERSSSHHHQHGGNTHRGSYQGASSNQQRGGDRIRTNFFPIRMLPNRLFQLYSFSVTCGVKTVEWNELPEGAKSWANGMLNIVPFKFRLFNMLRKSMNLTSKVKGLPMFDGSLIVSIEEIPFFETFEEIIPYEKNEVKIPFIVKTSKVATNISVNNNIQEPKLEQAISFCLSRIFNILNMDRLGLAEVEKGGTTVDQYTVRDGVIPTLSFLGSGLCLSLTFKQKILSKHSMIETLKHELRGGQKNRISDMYRGISIIYNNRSFVIKEIDFKQTPLSTFKKDGKDVSYLDYYKERYNVKIRDTDQPLICVMVKMRNQKKQVNYLIPELCYISGINKKDLRRIPKKSVYQKEDYISKLASRMNMNESKAFTDSVGLQISDKALDSTFSVLPTPAVQGIDGMRGDKWTVSRNSIIDNLKNKDWALVAPRFLVDNFVQDARNYQLSNPIVFDLDDRRNDFMRDIEEYKHWDTLKFVFFLLPSENKNTYSMLKHFFNSKVGIPSQCIVCNGDWKKRLLNCFIQISAKVGGLIWNVERLNGAFVSVCGIEIQRKGRSVKGSVCLSLNTGNTLYHTVPFRGDNDAGQACDNIMKSLCEGLGAFKNRNFGGLPVALIIYISGHDSLDILTPLHDFSESEEMENTKICVLSVNKDANARFNINNENPPIGTVITSLSRYQTQEFYMNSCFISSNIGYSKPVRYQILLNRTDFTVDDLIKATFRQTHLYYNWNGSVRMPACLLYAKKSIESVDITQEDPSLKLRQVPYFL